MIASRFTGVIGPGALYMAQPFRFFAGWKTTLHMLGKGHMHPALASGINTRPPAGMKLIQQPGRCAPKCIVPKSPSRS